VLNAPGTLLKPTVRTFGAQSYDDPLTFGADIVLRGGDLTLFTVGGSGHDFTLANSGLATINGEISGVRTFTVQGAVDLNNSVMTTGDQNYNGTVTLAGPTDRPVNLVGDHLFFAHTPTGTGQRLTLNGTPIFVEDQILIAKAFSEAAKAFVDRLKISPFNPDRVDISIVIPPTCEFPEICTDSYEILYEQERLRLKAITQ
jgi:hypothetical protein